MEAITHHRDIRVADTNPAACCAPQEIGDEPGQLKKSFLRKAPGVLAEAPRVRRVSRQAQRRRVLVAYKYVPQYRRAFFERLRARLTRDRVDLDLIYGDTVGDEVTKADAVRLDWAIHVPNRYFDLGKRPAVYQPIARTALSYDLVIIEQANRLLVNPVLLAMNKCRLTRVAYWGHGKDFQGEDHTLARAVKRALVCHACWWFAYNELSAAVVRDAGFPGERITSVMNTIDNEVLAAHLREISPSEVEQQRGKLGLRGQNVCVFVGGMYDKKRLGYLLTACTIVQQAIPDFEILFMGSGPDRPLVHEFAARHRWAIVCGPTFGREKALNLKLAKLLLMPGLVGLAIVDAFVSEVPIVTTGVSYHSPEIDYLRDGVNGVIISEPDNVTRYSNEIIALLNDERRLSDLRCGCREAAKVYTIDSMVSRFADGIHRALA